ncbi:hypothetical protein V3C99_008128 [Haemonchus contortus]
MRLEILNDASTAKIEIEVNKELKLSSLIHLVTVSWGSSEPACDFVLVTDEKEFTTEDTSTLEECGIKDGSTMKLKKRTKLSEHTASALSMERSSDSCCEGTKTSHEEMLKTSAVLSKKWQMLDRGLQRAATAFPECFAKTPLLYLRCLLNGKEVIALVDTGAQASIISMDAAKKCDMVDAIDDRFSVTASGVGGTRASLGRILATTVRIEGMDILCSFDVFASDVQDTDVILGLDTLTKNHAVINISERTIQFANLGAAPFIPAEEAEKINPFTDTTLDHAN